MNKLIVILFAIAVAAAQPLSDEQKEMVKKIHEECASATGVEEEDILSLYEEGPADEPKIKEHLFCFLGKMEIINDDGEIQTETLKERLAAFLGDEAKAETIASKCAEKMDSPLETAFALGKCIHHEKHEK